MKIYTKTGDQGKTGLIGGTRVWKNSPRIEAYGTVDELNSVLGIIQGLIVEGEIPPEAKTKLTSLVAKIQNDLFTVGTQLAQSSASPKDLPTVTVKEVRELEEVIDELEKELPPLRQFILPGGHTLSGMIHLARSVCRRAERRSVELLKKKLTPPILVTYLNRLSDTLFVLARWTHHQLHVKEIPWQKKS